MNFGSSNENCGCRMEMNLGFNSEPVVKTVKCGNHKTAGTEQQSRDSMF